MAHWATIVNMIGSMCFLQLSKFNCLYIFDNQVKTVVDPRYGYSTAIALDLRVSTLFDNAEPARSGFDRAKPSIIFTTSLAAFAILP